MIQHTVNSVDVDPRAEPWLYIAEIEHRVANQYALAVATMSLAAAKCSDADVKATLGGAAQRLRDYANVHRALQAPLKSGMMDLSTYLHEISDAFVRASLGERGVSLTLIEQPVEIDAQRCWRVGLIVSELITNAVRHGFAGGPGAITIEMARSAGLVHCAISDDGRPSIGSIPGNGTNLVDALAEDLGGSVARQFSIDGTTVVLSFPELGDSGFHAVTARNGSSGRAKSWRP